MPPPVSVALPIHRAHPALARALRCVLDQEGIPEVEILLVLNAEKPNLPALRHAIAPTVPPDPRIRVLELPRPSLAAALNLALREARFDLVARMDDDDGCPPHRLLLQSRALEHRPDLLAIACAWELADATGLVRRTMRPPCEPSPLRARLLLGNCLAHGSVMLRRSGVLALGAYDESLDRAQDYDLWLRLSARAQIACLPDVLYAYTADHDELCSSDAQALAAATSMLQAWQSLPAGDDPRVVRAIANALLDEQSDAKESLDAVLAENPTREALLARLWLDWARPPMPRRAIDTARRALLREVGQRLRRLGTREVILYGSGNHARWIINHAHDLSLPIVALADDSAPHESTLESASDPADASRERSVAGLPVVHPSSLRPGQCVLIASDAFEDEIWRRAQPLRDRGVHVFRLYEPAPDTSASRRLES